MMPYFQQVITLDEVYIRYEKINSDYDCEYYEFGFYVDYLKANGYRII